MVTNTLFGDQWMAYALGAHNVRQTMINKRTRLFFVTTLMIMVGCSQISTSQPDGQKLTETPYLAPTILIKTPVPSETTVTTLPTVTNSPMGNCLSIEPDYPTDLISTGTLILSGKEDIENNLVRYAAYKINMANHEELEFSEPGENILYISVSPDGRWMSYKRYVLDRKSDSLVIEDSSGKQKRTIPWEKEWSSISTWLDVEKLLIDVDTPSNSDSFAVSQSSTFLVFNPFTDERQILPPDFPNIFESQGFSGLVGTAYNLQLDRVVYLQGDPSFLEPLHYVLWDINKERVLASFEVVIEPTALPSWSPDGGKFSLAASIKENILETWPAYELYSVSRDGQINQLTHLTDYHPWVYIDDYSWSPDGRHIAFWFSWWSEENPGWELQGERYLAVVDTENNVMTNYCIQGKPGDSGRVPLPVWSPDGKQLVVENPGSEGHSRVVLIDLERQLAVQIAEDKKPEGWMVAP